MSILTGYRYHYNKKEKIGSPLKKWSRAIGLYVHVLGLRELLFYSSYIVIFPAKFSKICCNQLQVHCFKEICSFCCGEKLQQLPLKDTHPLKKKSLFFCLCCKLAGVISNAVITPVQPQLTFPSQSTQSLASQELVHSCGHIIHTHTHHRINVVSSS